MRAGRRDAGARRARMTHSGAQASAPADALLTDLYQLSMLQGVLGTRPDGIRDLRPVLSPPANASQPADCLRIGGGAGLPGERGRHAGGPGVPVLAEVLLHATFLTDWSGSGSGARWRAVPEGTPVFGQRAQSWK